MPVIVQDSDLLARPKQRYLPLSHSERLACIVGSLKSALGMPGGSRGRRHILEHSAGSQHNARRGKE